MVDEFGCGAGQFALLAREASPPRSCTPGPLLGAVQTGRHGLLEKGVAQSGPVVEGVRATAGGLSLVRAAPGDHDDVAGAGGGHGQEERAPSVRLDGETTCRCDDDLPLRRAPAATASRSTAGCSL
ncbi:MULTISPECIES: hypothetical protein [unclassified Streptomyces]|uniref:hypothetical protein n=1 Tax=unclassified Streptomyces TaxID=2593676 RepID=UPI00344FEE5B